MNMKRRLMVVVMVVAMLASLLPCVFAFAAGDTNGTMGYVVGNSLTMSMSPRRLAALMKTQGYDNVTLGGQLNGDTSLPEQIGMRPVNGGEYEFTAWRRHDPNDVVRKSGMSKPGTISDPTHGLDENISGHYFTAMSKDHYDFVSLQLYGSYANTPDKWEDYHYNHTVRIGARITIDNSKVKIVNGTAIIDLTPDEGGKKVTSDDGAIVVDMKDPEKPNVKVGYEVFPIDGVNVVYTKDTDTETVSFSGNLIEVRGNILTVGGTEYYEYQYLGDRQAVGLMVEFAINQLRENGKGSDTFLIYESWTYLNRMRGKGFSEFYNDKSYSSNKNGSTADIGANQYVPNKYATEELMSGLREDFSYLDEDTIRLVPVSAVLAKLDEMIIDEELPGFAEYMERNSEYYKKARDTQPSGVPQELLDNVYVPEQGIFNLFVDSVHMAAFEIKNFNGQAKYTGYHSGACDGTLASYITAVTMYSVLTGYSPVGLPVDMNTTDRKAQFVKADEEHNARLDATADAELIRAVQEVIFEVLSDDDLSRYTGITKDAPQRTASTSGNAESLLARVSTALAEAPAHVATEVALVISENPVWTPANILTAAPVLETLPEEKKSKED